MHHNKCMEKYDYEIDMLLKKEAMRDSDEVDYNIQKELHLLFENRRHLIEYMNSNHQHEISAHKNVVQGEAHKHSYFGD